MKQIAFLVVLLASLATGRAAHADPKEEARRHFDRGVELVDDGQLEGALVEFQRSYDLTHHFAVLYNIGQVLVSLARPVEALSAYERYLAEGQGMVPLARRAEVEKEMARQKSRIATIEIRGLPDGAVVRLDNREVGRAPLGTAWRVAVGRHAITATAEGYEPVASEFAVAGEDYKVVSLAMAKKAVTAPLPPAAPPAAAAPPAFVVAAPPGRPAGPSMSKLRIAGIVSGAAGVAALGAGLGFWLAAESRHDDAMKAYQGDYDQALSLQSEARSYVTAANISLVAGGVLVAAGVVSFIVGAPDKATASPGMQAYLLPSMGANSAGLSAGGTW